MNCPVCNKILAPTLSICPSCGAMMNDSVREELNAKVVAAQKLLQDQLTFEVKTKQPAIQPFDKPIMNKPMTPAAVNPPIVPNVQPSQAPLAAIAPKPDTMEIMAKATSPTLVEFQHKNATLPEWRLQVQNAVRKRIDTVQPTVVAKNETAPTMSGRVSLQTSGSAALKAEYIEETVPASTANPKLANALRRIEESRRKFLTADEPKEEAKPASAPGTPKSYPFYLATKNAEVLPKPAERQPAPTKTTQPAATSAAPPAVILEELPVLEKKPLDTNRLKPLPNAAVISTSLERVAIEKPKHETEMKDAPLISISRVAEDDDELIETEEYNENDDVAPFGMRFNSGVFDLIIGSFTSLILLAPFMLSGGSWFSIAGFFAFLVTAAIVMFIYMTTAVGLFGKTIGMKIFSLETIDVEENDYPTFHQAAVSSSVFLVSLALGGIGFLPALFNADRRTAPDLLSGTVIVKEES